MLIRTRHEEQGKPTQSKAPLANLITSLMAVKNPVVVRISLLDPRPTTSYHCLCCRCKLYVAAQAHCNTSQGTCALQHFTEKPCMSKGHLKPSLFKGTRDDLLTRKQLQQLDVLGSCIFTCKVYSHTHTSNMDVKVSFSAPWCR